MPVSDYSSPVTTMVNIPPQFSANSTTLTFTLVTGTNQTTQFSVRRERLTGIARERFTSLKRKRGKRTLACASGL
jgi:hypothetical protein